MATTTIVYRMPMNWDKYEGRDSMSEANCDRYTEWVRQQFVNLLETRGQHHFTLCGDEIIGPATVAYGSERTGDDLARNGYRYQRDTPAAEDVPRVHFGSILEQVNDGVFDQSQEWYIED